MSGLDGIKEAFFEECEELMEALFEGLELMATGDADAETLNAVFRAVHSVKGSAGAFGMDRLVHFAHQFETVLDRVRNADIEISEHVMAVLQRAGDQIFVLIEAEQTQDWSGVSTEVSEADLDGLLGPAPAISEALAEDFGFAFDAVSIDIAAPLNARETYSISLQPKPGMFSRGLEIGHLLAELAEFGEMRVDMDTSKVPLLADLDPNLCYLSWTIELVTEEPESRIYEVFEFLDGDCVIKVERKAEAEDVKEAVPTTASPAPPAETVSGDTPKQTKAPKSTLRVELDRVDRLINTVGELIINQSMMTQRLQGLGSRTYSEAESELEEYKRLARDIQDAVMAIRAQPVKPLFHRMSRIVREAADATGKQAKLTLAGEATEVDKALIEQLVDPLTHMIRNAVDHGLEEPEARRTAGKVETGEIILSAAHRSGSVVIEIRDDGAGLNREKIQQIAMDKGLIADGVVLSDADIDNLLFMPGFSTSTTVSELSGRGVGMDVVKNAIMSLGGRVSIASTTGRGTSFKITLPLTLAVMDGMLVSVADQTMVVPITAVIETVRTSRDRLHDLGSGEQLLSVRGRFVPVLYVAQELGFETRSYGAADEVICLLVETQNADLCAFVVDDIAGQGQVVVKGLDQTHGTIPGVSAATILGNGHIALILDPNALVTEEARYGQTG